MSVKDLNEARQSAPSKGCLHNFQQTCVRKDRKLKKGSGRTAALRWESDQKFQMCMFQTVSVETN